MKKKVRVKILPKAVYGMNVTGKINNKDGSAAGTGSMFNDTSSIPDIGVHNTLQPTEREHATLEAEKGETVVTQLDQANSGGIPEFYTIAGKPHSQGGTPLNLPPDSFIFSKDKKMKVSDPDILEQFGKSAGKKKNKSFTPADISKQYNINKYRKILADPNSDFHAINTAKQMITNYNLKLGALAMVQESRKGFDNGIPGIAMPYLDNVGIDPMELIPQAPDAPMVEPMPMGRFGMPVGMPTYPEGGETDSGEFKFDPNLKINSDSIAITPGTQNVNQFNLQPRTTDLTKKYDYLQGYKPTYDATGKKVTYGKTAAERDTNPVYQRKNELSARELEIRKEMANIYSLPTNAQGLPDYQQMDPDAVLDKTQMPEELQKEFYDVLYEKRAIRDAQGYKRKQYYGDKEAVQKGYSEDTPLEELSLGIRFSTGVQSKQLQELEAQKKAESLEALTLASNQYGGDIPEYAKGGPVRSQNVPSLSALQKQGLAKWDMTADGYNEEDVQAGDYVKKADGKWYQTTMEDIITPEFDGTVDPALGGLGEAYGRLEQRISENTELQDALYKKYKENMNKAKPRNNLSAVDLEAARGLSKEEVISNFLRAQKQIMTVQAKGPIEDKAGVWDKDLNNYKNTISELGYEPMSAAETAAFQGAYISMQNLMDADPKFREQLADFNIGKDTQKGKSDEPGGGTGRATISDIDGWFGNTTIGQAALYAPAQKQLAMKEAEWIEAKKDPAVKHLQNTYQEQKTPFWTEDIINEAFALKNLWGIKKNPPWNAMPGTKLPNATFASPDQQIQNILGASGQGVKGAGAFGSPQGFVANTAAIQANAMNSVANAIGNVQDKNVQVANQFELQRSNIMNRANEKRSQLATNLHDKNAILNQQFSNAKNKAWDEVRQSMVNMWTNRGKTQNLNTFSDQYDIDPRTGFKQFNTARPLTPKNAQPFNLADRTNELLAAVPGLKPEAALAQARREGAGTTSATGFSGADPTELGPGYPGGAPSGYQ